METVSGPLENSEGRPRLTVDDVINGFGFGCFQLRLTVFAVASRMITGFVLVGFAIIAPAVRCDLHLSSWEESFIAIALVGGMMCGAPAIGIVMDKYGRRLGLFVGRVWMAVACLTISFSPNYATLIVLSFFMGLGFSSSDQIPAFYSEFLSSKHRGCAVVLLEVGLVAAAVILAAIAIPVMEYLGWRWLVGFMTLPIFLSLPSFLLVPESPRYSVASGKSDKAQKTLQMIARRNSKSLPPGMLVAGGNEFSINSTSSSSIQSTHRGQFRDLFATWKRSVTTVLVGIMFFAIMGSFFGIGLLTTEMLSIIAEHQSHNSSSTGIVPCIAKAPHPINGSACARLTENDYLQLMWVSAGDVPGLFVAMALVERVGRKLTIALQSLGAAAAFFLMYICPVHKMVLMFFIFTARALISGALMTVFVYTSEVYPTSVRAVGSGTGAFMGRLGCIASPLASQVLLRESVRGAQGAYAGLAITCAVAALLLPIETKGNENDGDTIRKDSKERLTSQVVTGLEETIVMETYV